MPLFTQRLVARQEAAARARGENVDGLIDEAPGEFRQPMACYMVHNGSHAHDVWPYLTGAETVAAIAAGLAAGAEE